MWQFCFLVSHLCKLNSSWLRCSLYCSSLFTFFCLERWKWICLYVFVTSYIFAVIVQLISDAGYQGEITSVSTACQQLEVFSRVLRTSLATLLDGGEENLEKNLPEFAVSIPQLLCLINRAAMKYEVHIISIYIYNFLVSVTFSFECISCSSVFCMWLTLLSSSLLFPVEDGVSRRAHLSLCPGDDVHPRSGGAGRFCCS